MALMNLRSVAWEKSIVICNMPYKRLELKIEIEEIELRKLRNRDIEKSGCFLWGPNKSVDA